MRQTPKILEVHHAKFGGAQFSPVAAAAKSLSFLFVYSSVRHVSERHSLCVSFRHEGFDAVG